jgi:hypothetical protein
MSIEADELGVLQITDRWASVTATARVRPSGETRAVVVIVDAGDPIRRDDRAAIRIAIQGVSDVIGRLPPSDVRIGHQR